MSLSLYQSTIPTYLQITGAIAGLIDKAEAHCTNNDLSPDELIHARLADDMLSFAYQIHSVATHSLGAIEGVKKGVFSPNMTPPPVDFAGLGQRIADARSGLEALTEADINALEGKPMRFEYGDFKIDFVAEKFLLSFSQPNFYFHATTAYDILRWKGLAIGKSDFMGQLRTV